MSKTKPISKKYHVYTLGCQMNFSDSERLKAILENIGFKESSDIKTADLIVFNTCSVKQQAEDRVIGMARLINILKANNPDLKVLLTGCMARRKWRETDAKKAEKTREEELKDVMPWLDFVIETKDFGLIPNILGLKLEGNSENILKNVGGTVEYLSFHPKHNSSFQAFVPISVGCDHFCTYCIVPFARGNEICRDFESVFVEVLNLVKNGYKDITLLGQTVNRWVNPLFDDVIKKGQIGNAKIPGLNTKPLNDNEIKEWEKFIDELQNEDETSTSRLHDQIVNRQLTLPQDFFQLLQVLELLPGEWLMTWMSSHPNYMTEELIKFIGTSKHQRPYLHFALQSGSNTVLKRMNRRYSYEEFKNVVDLMRKYIKGLAISTDIIVGFPKESEEDFLQSVRAMEECKFDLAFISEFSPRTGTPASLINNDVPEAVKAERKRILNDDYLKKVALENNQKMLNTVERVLVFSQNKKEQLMGRTPNFKEIRIKNSTDKNLIGEFVDVKVTSCTPWSLEGELIN
jgi:tRNA-2-methylthio-N6-dimethylallyladenosine synthase